MWEKKGRIRKQKVLFSIILFTLGLFIIDSGCLENISYYVCELSQIEEVPIGYSFYNMTSQMNLALYPDLEYAINSLVDPNNNETSISFSMSHEEFKPLKDIWADYQIKIDTASAFVYLAYSSHLFNLTYTQNYP